MTHRKAPFPRTAGSAEMPYNKARVTLDENDNAEELEYVIILSFSSNVLCSSVFLSFQTDGSKLCVETSSNPQGSWNSC